MRADYIIKSNNIFTAGPKGVIKGFLTIKENKIIYIGNNTENISSWIGNKTVILDYENNFVMPGLIDCHVHFLFGGLELLTNINLSFTASEEEAAEKVFKEAKTGTGQWVLGFGWFQCNWDNPEFPTKKSLDKYFTANPVCLFNKEFHSVWLNSAALKACGIDRNSSDPEFGKILRDIDGGPTGCLLEKAAFNIMDKICTKLNFAELIEPALAHASKFGITSLSDIDINNSNIHKIYRKLELQNKLTARINFSPLLSDDFEKLNVIRKKYNSPFLKLTGLKVFLDGTVAAKTACMLEPYSDLTVERGKILADIEKLEANYLKADKNGYSVRFHACGDGAIRYALDLIEKAQKLNNSKDSRNTIEHIECIHPDDIKRFSKLGVIASVQPIHLAENEFAKHPFPAILGKERIKYSWPFQSFIKSGAKIAFGTDFPIVSIDPFENIYTAVTRLQKDKKPEGGWNPEEKLTMEQSLKAYTIDAAYLNFREKEIGSLEKGKLADITVLDKNLFAISDNEEILNTKAVMTMVNGNIVYQK